MPQKSVIILDNGAYVAKIGLAGSAGLLPLAPTLAPNCLTKLRSESRRPAYVADQIEEAGGSSGDLSGLYYQLAFQRGYLVHWDVQKQVWDRLIHHTLPQKFPSTLGYDGFITPEDTEIVVTVPPHNLRFVGESMDEIFFEEYNLAACLQITASTLSALRYANHVTVSAPESAPFSHCLVVDTGFSFTHLSHYASYGSHSANGIGRNGSDPKSSLLTRDEGRMRRIDVGGKLLTNYLKDIISYRQLHVMDETYVINQVKEDACYVSQNFVADMEACKKMGYNNSGSIACQYVLPDFQRLKRGYIRSLSPTSSSPRDTNKEDEDYQILNLGNERITVPELLFHPTDVGIAQMGMAEAIVESLEGEPQPRDPSFSPSNGPYDGPLTSNASPILGSGHVDTNSSYYKNILLTGGSASFPGLSCRLAHEVRAMANAAYDVNVYLPADPITYAWYGGNLLVSEYGDFYDKLKVTRSEYQENGAHRISHNRINL